MQIEAALIKEQGITFVVAPVKSHILGSPTRREEVRRAISAYFDGAPTILMEQDVRGVPTFHGRRDIANFLRNVPLDRLPWRRYRITNAA